MSCFDLTFSIQVFFVTLLFTYFRSKLLFLDFVDKQKVCLNDIFLLILNYRKFKCYVIYFVVHSVWSVPSMDISSVRLNTVLP